jgi:hypothetical protein
VPAFESAEALMRHVANARGKLRKGGLPDVEVRTSNILVCECLVLEVLWRTLPHGMGHRHLLDPTVAGCIALMQTL